MSCIVKFRAVIFSNMLSNIEEISCCYLFPGKPLCKQNHFRAFTSLEKLTLVADETSPQVSAKCLWRLRAVQGDGRRSGNRDFAKDCLLTGQEQACTRINWLFTCLLVRHHAENGPIHREMVVDCALVITSKVKPFSRPDKTKKEVWMIQSVFCIYSWHWVLLTNQSTQTHYIHTNIKMKERFV